LTWLGQAGFLVETGGKRLLIDPWTSPLEGRLIDPPPLELVAERIDWVLVTHEHVDHLDPAFLATLAARSPGARLVLPEPVAQLAGDVLPVVPARPGEQLALDGLHVQVLPAWHGVTMADAYTDGGGRFLGYAFDGIYHSGDTILADGLLAALAAIDVDTALLPINGRDAEREARGLVGNLDADEAVELARRIGARTLVPMHWDGVAGNTERPGRAADAAAAAGGPHVLVLERLVPA
jgi:L-ascorbate metabolism protein UlaG (beta-lactamase superfamily)